MNVNNQLKLPAFEEFKIKIAQNPKNITQTKCSDLFQKTVHAPIITGPSNNKKTIKVFAENSESIKTAEKIEWAIRSDIKSLHKGIQKIHSARVLDSSQRRGNIDKVFYKTPQENKEDYGEEGDLDLPSGKESILLENSKKTIPSEKPVLEEEYKIEGISFGKEQIKRYNTLDDTIRILQNSIDNEKRVINSLGKESPQNLKELNKRKENLRFFVEQLVNCLELRKQEEKNWLDSNYFRDHLRKNDSLLAAYQTYVSSPINMRDHEFQRNGESIVRLKRLGVISDMRNGFMSLADLKKMRYDEQLIEKKIAEAEEKIKKPKLSFKEKILSKFGIKRISKATERSLEAANISLNLLKMIKTNRGAASQILENMIEDRRRILNLQMVQLVGGQITQHPDLIENSIREGKSFDLVHVSLLNPKTRKMDKTGWNHDEFVEMEDMREIFHEFKGKTVIFSSKGPYLEGDIIYLPSSNPELLGKSIKINPYFLNISVQGCTTNHPKQKGMNTEELKLEPQLISDQVISEKLKNGQDSNYDLAIEVIEHLLDRRNSAVSVGCLSAKDRTGVVCASIMQNRLNKFLPPEKKEYFRNEMLSANSVAAKVVAENTGLNVLKIHLFASIPRLSKLKQTMLKANLLWLTLRGKISD